MPVTLYHWIFFNVLILVLLGMDLWRFHRDPKPKSFGESVLSCLGWVGLALLFNGCIYIKFGSEPALNFLTGYLLEESLSVDNLFIFLLIFAHFKVPESSKHLVLFYGVLGAIIMRGLLIWGGIVFVHHFAWAFYLFGAFLVYTGIRLALNLEKAVHGDKVIQDLESESPSTAVSRLNKGEGVKIQETGIYRLFNRYLGMTPEYHGNAFIIRQGASWAATPLLLVLLLIESTDLLFALDSVPAILGITTEPFIVYTSNVFAVLGLRSLFFVLEKGMGKIHFIHDAIAAILVFIGIKMLIQEFYSIPSIATFAVLIFLLGGAIILSAIFPQKDA